MCGIVGTLIFRDTGARIDPGLLAAMRDTMEHRGPNGGASWISKDGRVGLGHRRLSIIDLSTAADQPMSNDDGSVTVVFNGEIYNHAEIRREIQSIRDFRWQTDHSDTEVLLRAYETWGIDALQKFRGMFGIGIWDSRTRDLWLVRDRIGVKPVYYSVYSGRLSFASEIKALLKDPLVERGVGERSLFDYLSFISTPAPQTLYKNIQKLAPGSWLRISEDGQIREQRYWDMWDHTKPMTGVSDDEIAGRLLDELRTAVKLRKVSDVPVGVFLSGGVDSSTNAALFSEGQDGEVKTFTIGYEGQYDSYKNETDYARMMAERVGAKHHELLLTQKDLLDFLPTMIHLQDEPIGDPVCFPVYAVSKLARDNGVVVCQVGEGADELFWGYSTWKTKLRLQEMSDAAPVPNFVRHLGLAALRMAGKNKGHPYEALRRTAEGQPLFWSGADAFTQYEKNRVLSDRMRTQFADTTSWEALRGRWETFQKNAWEKSPLNWMSYCDLTMRLPELLLMRVDKMSMGVSLEGRVPFLDHKFVELAMSVPSEVKTRGGVSKHILKKAVRGLIPDSIIDRPKQGFGVPVYEWLFEGLGQVARTELSRFCDATDFLDKKEVLGLVERGEGPRAWYLLNLALWWSHFIDGDGLPAYRPAAERATSLAELGVK